MYYWKFHRSPPNSPPDQPPINSNNLKNIPILPIRVVCKSRRRRNSTASRGLMCRLWGQDKMFFRSLAEKKNRRGLIKHNQNLHFTCKVLIYIPVHHDISRQTNDCSPVRVMQHKVMYFLYPGRPSPWACGPRAGSTWSSARGSGPTLPQTLGFNNYFM